MRIQEIAQEVEALGVSLAGRDEAMAPEDVHRLRDALRRWHESLTALTNGEKHTAPSEVVGEVRPRGFRGDVQETPWGWQVVLRSPGRVPWDIEDAQALLDALDLPLEMFLCEANAVVLRPDRLYRFVEDPDCEGCREQADIYREAL